MASIRKFLDLSTAHLGEIDRILLDTAAEPGCVVGPLTMKYEYGWFMWASSDPPSCDDTTLTPALRAISVYARLHDCDYVLFDADGPVNDDLPVFEQVGGEA